MCTRTLGLFGLAMAICFLSSLVGIGINTLIPTPTYGPWISGTVDAPGVSGVFEEILVLPVNTDSDVLTAYRYAGDVTITIFGQGQIDENTGHDASHTFCLNEQECVRQHFYGFCIDDEYIVPTFYGSQIKVDSDHDHGYRILYAVGPELRHIAFRMLNDNEQDTSEFTIEISTENKVSASGR